MLTLDQLMTAAAKPRAYSYVRFSSKRQERGDSIRRQLKMSEEFAADHKLDLVQSFQDRGVSAFKGGNWEAGKLGRFVELVNSGEIPAGSWLIIESLDRLSRETVNLALPRILDLLNSGITIATTNPEQIYTRERLEKEPFSAVEILLTGIRASEESKTKSVRARRRWEHKRQEAAKKPITARLPHWLEMKDGKIVAIAERVKLIRWLFEEVRGGTSIQSLERKLNKDGVPAWSGTIWRRSYLHRLLTNKRLIGHFQPCKGSTRQPDGPVIENYFPAVIPEDLFFSVYNVRMAKVGPKGRRGTARNLFSGGICRCGYCGGAARLIDRGQTLNKKPVEGRYLVCSTAKAGGKCDYITWRYLDFEANFLHWINDFEFDRDDNAQRREVKGQIELATGQLAESKRRLEALFDLAGKVESASLAAKIQTEERKGVELEERIKLLKVALNRITGTQEVDIKALLDKPEDRETLRRAIRSKVAEITLFFDGEKGTGWGDPNFVVKLHSGEVVRVIGDEYHRMTPDGRQWEAHKDGRTDGD